MRFDSKNAADPQTHSIPSTGITRSHAQNPEVRRRRTILIVLASIQLILEFLGFIQRIVGSKNQTDETRGSYIGQIVSAILSLLYLVALILGAVKYNRITVLICAWLGILRLILIFIVIILGIVFIVAISTSAQDTGIAIIVGAIFLIAVGINLILAIATVVTAFKLATTLSLQGIY